MTTNIKIIFGVPYSVGKEFEAVLEEYNIKDLDTGASYVGLAEQNKVVSNLI